MASGTIKQRDCLSDTFQGVLQSFPESTLTRKNFYTEKCKKGGMPESTLPHNTTLTDISFKSRLLAQFLKVNYELISSVKRCDKR